jgi:hypothetical protein
MRRRGRLVGAVAGPGRSREEKHSQDAAAGLVLLFFSALFVVKMIAFSISQGLLSSMGLLLFFAACVWLFATRPQPQRRSSSSFSESDADGLVQSSSTPSSLSGSPMRLLNSYWAEGGYAAGSK